MYPRTFNVAPRLKSDAQISILSLSCVTCCLARSVVLVWLCLVSEGVVPALQPANRNVFNYLPQSIKMQVRVVQRYSRLPFLQRGAVACRRNHTTFQDLAR